MFGVKTLLPKTRRSRERRLARSPCRLTRPRLELLEDRSLPAPIATGMAGVINAGVVPAAQSLAASSLEVSLFAVFSSGRLSASGFPFVLQVASASRGSPPPISALGPASPARTFVAAFATPGAGVSLPPTSPYVRQDTSLSGGGNLPDRGQNPDDPFSDESQETKAIHGPGQLNTPNATFKELLSLVA
jgi:hypothetical protein